jgi:beta-phosphoglucomutase-like phosphatase (HAD superfamily)
MAGAVLFDIDGTLVDSNYVHVTAWLRALHEVDHPVDAWRIHRGMRLARRKCPASACSAEASAPPS